MKEYTYEMCRLIGKALVNRRKQLGRTQVQSSKLCGRSVYNLSSIENGFLKSLNLDILSEVCVGYDCSAQDILHDARALIDPDMADAMSIVESSQCDENISLDFLNEIECFNIGEMLGMLRVFSGKSIKFLSDAMDMGVLDIQAIESGCYSSLSQDLVVKYIRSCKFNDVDFLRTVELTMLKDKLVGGLCSYFVTDSSKVLYVVEPMVSLLVMVINTIYHDEHNGEAMPREYLSHMLRRMLQYVDKLVFDDIGSFFDSWNNVLPCMPDESVDDITGSESNDDVIFEDPFDDDVDIFEEDILSDIDLDDDEAHFVKDVMDAIKFDPDTEQMLERLAKEYDDNGSVPLKPYSIDLSQET